MKNVLYIFSIIISTCVYGQDDQVSKAWVIGCDTMSSQLDMNVCSYESFMIADSILTVLHTELTQYFEGTLKKEKEYIDSSKDSIQISYVNLLERQLTAYKKSQKDFYMLRDNIVDVINLQYDGGTMKPLAANTYALRLTINQIELVKIMIDEINN
jgi:uncharacterized protein YecT (DUF1311 family)